MSYPPIPQRKACDCSDPCISTDDVYYAGPNLPNSGINTYNVLTSVIEKLLAMSKFCWEKKMFMNQDAGFVTIKNNLIYT